MEANNAVVPATVPSWEPRTVRYDDLHDCVPEFVGADDHIGIAILKQGKAVLVYPRLCYCSSFRCGECGLLYCPYYPPSLGNIPTIVRKKNGRPHSSSTRDSV